MNEQQILKWQGKLCICFIFQNDYKFFISKRMFGQIWGSVKELY